MSRDLLDKLNNLLDNNQLDLKKIIQHEIDGYRSDYQNDGPLHKLFQQLEMPEGVYDAVMKNLQSQLGNTENQNITDLLANELSGDGLHSETALRSALKAVGVPDDLFEDIQDASLNATVTEASKPDYGSPIDTEGERQALEEDKPKSPFSMKPKPPGSS